MDYQPRKNIYLADPKIDREVLRQAKRFKLRGRSAWIEGVAKVLRDDPELMKEFVRRLR